MTRFEKLQKKWWRFFRLFQGGSPSFFLDIGSHTTKLLITGQQAALIPTCLVWEKLTHDLVSVGDDARAMLGKLPQSMEFVYPVRNGKIVHVAGTSTLLEQLIRDRCATSVMRLVIPPRLFFTNTCSQIEAQRDAWKNIVRKQSFRSKIVPEADALWKLLTAERVFTQDGCIIDIGAMTTKYYVFVHDRLACSFLSEFGGDHWTRMIVEQLRQHCHLEVSWEMAERLKKKAVRFGLPRQKHTVQGKNILTNLPETLVVDDDIFASSSVKLMEKCVEGFQQMAQHGNPETITKLIEKGIFVTGGGSQLVGMRGELEKRLKLPVTMSLTPQLDGVKGLKLFA